jgi:DnaJ-domain-containing protein 1
MADPRLEDHAIGVELQLTELTEELERARVQGRTERMAAIEREITALQDDLALTAEKIVSDHHQSAEIHADHADHAG